MIVAIDILKGFLVLLRLLLGICSLISCPYLSNIYHTLVACEHSM